MAFDFKGGFAINNLVLVTGGNRGIGLEVCRQLSEGGYTVILGSRDLAKGKEAARALGENVIPKKLDVTSQASVDALARWVESEYGRLDALVNNAAIDYDQDQNVLNANLTRVQKAFEVEYIGRVADGVSVCTITQKERASPLGQCLERRGLLTRNVRRDAGV